MPLDLQRLVGPIQASGVFTDPVFVEVINQVVPLATGVDSSVPDGVLTTLATITGNGAKRISKISVSGDSYAKFQLFLDTVLIDTRRTGPDRNTDFKFDLPMNLASGSVLDVKVTHFYTGESLGYEATIYGF